MKKYYFLFFLVTFSGITKAQFYFKKVDTVQVKIGNSILENAWAGGENFVQVSDIDLNQDGIMDLFVFDRCGNKISTYINRGTVDSVDYKYDWRYISKFPRLHDWALLRDYNCDGKMDIFTYSNGGAAVYRNDADTSGLKFTLVCPLIYSYYNPNWLNLYITLVDVPAIYDVDKDGDLDILTFSILGSFVEYHKNMSMENFGVCDSIRNIYHLDNSCWGNFSENGVNSSISLNQTCKGPAGNVDPQQGQHAGSALLCFDGDGDGDRELLVHDISSNGGTYLVNGGDTNTANIISQDVNFPSNTTQLIIPEFPSSHYVDVNNDGKRDLISSPNAQNLSENFNSMWWYKNTGTDAAPVFTFMKKNILQDEMIEVGQGAYPVFFDYDKDGLYDLVIGNSGYYTAGAQKSKLALFKNTGTATLPKFELVTRDFGNLSANNLRDIYPTFGDLDNDGDMDMVVGEEQGFVHYYENTAAAGNPANFVLAAPGLAGIDVGSFSMPQLVDLDRDGKLDLVIGEQSGNLNYYRNTGTPSNAVFTLVTSNLGNVKTNMPNFVVGYSAPRFIDVAGSYELLCGSESGWIFYYNNIENNLGGTFTLVDSSLYKIREGVRTALDVKDLNNDGYLEMVVGNYSGGLGFYMGDFTVSSREYANTTGLFELYPNPASDAVRVDFSRNRSLKDAQVLITDVMGHVVMKIDVSGTYSFLIPVDHLARGIYFVQASSGNAAEVKKLVIGR